MTKTIKGRKFVATAATAALVASAIVPVASAASLGDFKDASKVDSWAKESVEYVLENGFLTGNADGTFAPQGSFSRAQAAQVIVNYLGLDTKNTTAQFSDVTAGKWYYGAVNAAATAGKVNGVGGGKYNPEANLSRQDAAKIFGALLNLDTTKADLSVLDQFSDKAKIADYADEYVAIFVKAGVLNGKGTNFDPAGNITRQELAKMIASADKADKAGKLEEFKNVTVTPEPTPEVTPEVTPEPTPEVTVATVNAVEAITIVKGTDVTTKLPTTVEAVLTDASKKVTLNVTWTAPEAFKGEAGTYTFTGTLKGADNVVIPEGKEKATAVVTVITEAAFEDLVAAVKVEAEKADNEANFKAALTTPVLELKVKEANIAAYKTAIAEAFSAATVEEIQAIIDTVDAKADAKAAEAEAKLVKAIVEATTAPTFKAALYVADAKLKHLVVEPTTAELNAYRTAIVAANPTSLKEVQAVIESVNNATVEKAVAAAEAAATAYATAAPLAKTTADLKTAATTADSAADAVLVKYAALYTGEEVFDVKAKEEDKAGKFATRLAAVEKTITDADAAVLAAQIAFDIDALKPSITAKQNPEVTTGDSKAKSTVDVTVKYKTVTDVTKDLYGKGTTFKVDSKITVPAAFAGATLSLKVDGATVPATVPAVAKEGDTTISFSLATLLDAKELTDLVDNNGDEWTVSIEVPYESTTLAAGNYTVTFESVVSPDFSAKEDVLDVRTIASTSLNVKVIGDPAVPAAIQAVYAAAKEEKDAETTLVAALEALKKLSADLTFDADNKAEYVKAFKAANATGATIATVQAVIDATDKAVDLANAIALLETADASEVISKLAVESFGYVKSKHTVLTVVANNASLYVDAIEAAVEAKNPEGTKTPVAAFTTVEEVKALLDAVNASKLGTLNAQTTLTGIETALLALGNADVNLVYNALSDKTAKLVALRTQLGTEGFANETEVVDFLLAK